jgi:hypothetical protein
VYVTRLRVKVEAIYRDEKEVNATRSGENLRLRITGAEETDISAGFVLSSIKTPVPIVTQFEAQLMIVELLEHNSIFTVSGGLTGVALPGEQPGRDADLEAPTVQVDQTLGLYLESILSALPDA